jgi:hypothetical protein
MEARAELRTKNERRRTELRTKEHRTVAQARFCALTPAAVCRNLDQLCLSVMCCHDVCVRTDLAPLGRHGRTRRVHCWHLQLLRRMVRAMRVDASLQDVRGSRGAGIVTTGGRNRVSCCERPAIRNARWTARTTAASRTCSWTIHWRGWRRTVLCRWGSSPRLRSILLSSRTATICSAYSTARSTRVVLK